MLLVDATGVVVNARVKRALSPSIERGAMKSIHGIIVHQTGGPTAQSTLDSYKRSSAEPVTSKQNTSLQWLITELVFTLKVPMTEIFRHPDVSRKNPSEASTAKW